MKQIEKYRAPESFKLVSDKQQPILGCEEEERLICAVISHLSLN